MSKKPTYEVFEIQAECSEDSCPEDATFVVVAIEWEAQEHTVFMYCTAHANEAAKSYNSE